VLFRARDLEQAIEIVADDEYVDCFRISVAGVRPHVIT
jgi:hypothetical protein